MANMSYCRFHNTNMDVNDCIEALYEGTKLSDIDGKKPYAEKIAEFDLCKCGYEFVDIFKDEANCYIYINDEPVTEDCYGDTIKSADIIDVYNAIEYGDYWRTTALKDFLHSLIVNRDILSRDFESLKVYHYGY